jgi:hypothetical protein
MIALTVAVNVTCWFTVEPAGAEFRVIEVAPAPTPWLSAAEALPVKFALVLV